MIYKETECLMGDYYYSFSTQNLGKKYQQWVVPCRILGVTPAEYVRILKEDYNALIRYNPEKEFLSRRWESQSDMRRWKNYINKKARERNFHI